VIFRPSVERRHLCPQYGSRGLVSRESGGRGQLKASLLETPHWVLETGVPVKFTRRRVIETGVPMKFTRAPVIETGVRLKFTRAPVIQTDAPLNFICAPVMETDAPLKFTQRPAQPLFEALERKKGPLRMPDRHPQGPQENTDENPTLSIRLHGQKGSRLYSFTAPAVSPLMNCFDKNRYSRMMGMDAEVSTARILFQSVWYWPNSLITPSMRVR